MAIKQSEIAKAWNVDKGYVSRLVKRRGKPFESIEQANQWREENAKQGVGLRRKLINNTGSPQINLNSKSIESSESDSLLEALKRVEQNEKAAYLALEESVKNNSRSNFKILTTNYSAAFKALVDARLMYQQAQLREGKLIKFDDAKQSFGSILQSIRTMLDTMPKSLAARCNPTDPELAMTAIQDYIENQFLKVLNQGDHESTSN